MFNFLLDFYWDMGSKWLCLANDMNFLARTGHPLPKPYVDHD